MSAGEIKARHFGTGKPVELRWKNGRITSVEPIAEAAPNLWVAPALERPVRNRADTDHLRELQLAEVASHLSREY